MTTETRINTAFSRETQFNEIFTGGFDYVVHRTATNKNGFFLWKNGIRADYPGAGDTRGNYAYIRFQNEDTSFTVAGNLMTANLRFVGSLVNCKNTERIAQYIVGILQKNGFAVNSVNLNTAAVWIDEMGKKEIRSDNIDVFSVDFSLVLPPILQCDINNLFCENC